MPDDTAATLLSQDALIAYASWVGYGHPERARAWADRMEVNRPELEGFARLREGDAQPYRPAPTALRFADGGLAHPALSGPSVAEALERARAATELHAFTWIAEASPEHGSGFLAGVPVAVKDLIGVRGMPLSCGTRAGSVRVPAEDAESVARLRRAGAAIVAGTNLHELAYGITSDNPRFGRVANPAARDRLPGGSSGGSAAAIAAGIVRGALGTDTGGSVRIPAACCGIVGFKPSYDAVPRNGVVDLAPSLDHVGPLGRSVADCAALFAALLDLEAIPAWRATDLRGVRVARLIGYFDEPLDAAVRAAVAQALEALASEGARRCEAAIAGIEAAPAIQLNTIAPEATAIHTERLREHGSLLGEDVRVRLETGLFLPAAWYVKAQRLRSAFVAGIESAFAQADVLVCPTLRVPAPRIGLARVDIGGQSYPLHTAMTQLTAPFNLAGLPAVSLPWSASSEGVPIGIQLVGARGEDWRLLALAERLERASPWQRAHAA